MDAYIAEVATMINRVKETVVGILSEDFEVVEQPNCRF